jgi:hypothetical protein
MGAPKNPVRHSKTQEGGRRKGLPRRPRTRRCLLKGCEQRFHPRQARQRYCGEVCREAARQWSRWKAQERYRATTTSKQKRNAQNLRYRERVKSRNSSQPEAVSEAARVITTGNFFRPLLRPGRLLQAIRTPAAKPFAAFLFAYVPACVSAGRRAGAALETASRFNPEILIHIETRLTFSLSDATGVSPARPTLGAPAGAPSDAAAAFVGVAGRLGPANARRGGGGRRPSGPLRGHRRL